MPDLIRNPMLDKISPTDVAFLARSICSVGDLNASWYNQPQWSKACDVASELLIIAANCLQNAIDEIPTAQPADESNKDQPIAYWHQEATAALQRKWEKLFPARSPR